MPNVTSTLITNRAATPRVANAPWNHSALRNAGVGITAVTTGEIATNILRFVEVPANAVMRNIRLSCTAIPSAGVIRVGVYRSADDGGTVVDDDLFAINQAVTAVLSNVDITHQSGEYTHLESNMPLWQAAGMAAPPPSGWLVIAATITTAMGGAGSIALSATYADGGA